MSRRNSIVLLGVLLLAGLSVTAAPPPPQVFVPQPVGDKIKAVETTKLDIGEPNALFDNDPATLIRTPSINPAYVRVEFTEPITCDLIRLILIDVQHTWTLAVADNMEDLKAKSGSYRVLIKDRVTPKDRVDIPFEQPQTIKAAEFTVLRQGGDDYVHIAEWQFCKPAAVDKLEVQRVTDRREAGSPKGVKAVEGPIEVPVQTVVWLRAKAVAGGVTLDIADGLTWQTSSAGVVPFGDQPGMFLVRQEGQHKVTAQYAGFAQEFTLVGTPRTLANRKPDIDVLFIERLPRLDYDGPNGGWPAVGSDVTWRGHVYNWGSEPVRVKYEWKLDGAVVGSGEQDIPPGPPGAEATPVEWPWKWDAARHDLTLTVTPVQPLAELIEKNNTLTIQTNAITVGFWVEQSLWDFHHEHQHRLPLRDANSFADWAQRMMRQWNAMFVAAVYPEYPQGITERVRLDRLVVVPDFALPLAGGLPSNNPDNRDKTIDIVWGHEAGDLQPGSEVKADHWWSPERAIKGLEEGLVEKRKADPPFWCGLGYIHEMGHARYLVDAYGFNVHTGQGTDIAQRKLKVTDEQGPILGRYMPLKEDIQHWQKYPGNMAGSDWFYSLYETMCWNRVAGKRARGGNCNGPSVIGEFLQDIPARLVYEFVDPNGQPLADAEVWGYRARGTGKDWYTKVFEDPAGVKGRTDARGRVVFDRTLFAEDGKIVHTYGASNAVVLLRVTHGGQHYFLFEEVTDANIAYNLGQHDECVLRRQLKLRTGEPKPEEWDPKARWEPAPAERGGGAK